MPHRKEFPKCTQNIKRFGEIFFAPQGLTKFLNLSLPKIEFLPHTQFCWYNILRYRDCLISGIPSLFNSTTSPHSRRRVEAHEICLRKNCDSSILLYLVHAKTLLGWSEKFWCTTMRHNFLFAVRVCAWYDWKTHTRLTWFTSHTWIDHTLFTASLSVRWELLLYFFFVYCCCLFKCK